MDDIIEVDNNFDYNEGEIDGFMIIHIKSPTFNGEDINLYVNENIEICTLKQKIRDIKNLHTQNIRIIYCGRVLEDSRTLKDYRIPNEANIHCFITNNPPNINRSTSEDQILRGFDRLSEMGFTEDEITHFRLQFYANHENDEINNTDYHELEEEWINNHFSPSQLIDEQEREQDELRNEGSYEDLFFGMIIGFILGLIMLIWMWDRSMTRRMKFGIIAGIGCNISFGLIRLSRTLS